MSIRQGLYFILFVVFYFTVMFVFMNKAVAANLFIENKTGAVIRIAHLRNKCIDDIVPESKPVYISAGAKAVFVDVLPVIHTYTICGSGYCTSSAVGFDDKTFDYTIVVTLGNPYIRTNLIPDIWPGNIECKK